MNQSIPACSSDPVPSRCADGGIVQFVDLHAAAHCWEVSPGAVVHSYGFNGQVPGPVIEATVGDRLLVHVSNGMDQPITLVWDAASAADTPMSTATTRWVVPGVSHPFEHALTDPGAFAYRAIARLQTAKTLGGLCGVLLVKGPAEPAVDHERVLVVHQAELTTGRRAETHHSAPSLRRLGAPVLLLNGARHATIEMSEGSQERWRILNVAADVQLRLSLPRHPERGLADDRQVSSPDPMRPGQPRLAAGLDLRVGPFRRGDQITLGALIAGGDWAGTGQELLTCHVM